MSCALLLVALTVSAPFEDVQKRFSLDLPPGWEFAPQPGDTDGAFFRRVVEGMIGNATVRVMQFSKPIDLPTLTKQVAAAVENEPGYRLLVSQQTTLAGQPAVRRRYVLSINGDPQWPKMVEQRIAVIGGIGYVVHVETVADAFGVFENDFNKLIAGFYPGPTRQAAEGVPPPEGAEPVALPAPAKSKGKRAPDARAIIGLWAGGGHSLQLSPGGTVVFDALHGSYRLDNGSLVVKVQDREIVMDYQLTGDNLRISGGTLGDGQNFHRMPVKSGQSTE